MPRVFFGKLFILEQFQEYRKIAVVLASYLCPQQLLLLHTMLAFVFYICCS